MKTLFELNEGDTFVLNSIFFKISSFEMEGVKCVTKDNKLEYFSYSQLVFPFI